MQVLERRVDRRLISREGEVNTGIDVGTAVLRTTEAMVELDADAKLPLERRDAASVDQGSVRGISVGVSRWATVSDSVVSPDNGTCLQRSRMSI